MQIRIDQQNRLRTFFAKRRRKVQGRRGLSIPGQGARDQNTLQFPGPSQLAEPHSQESVPVRGGASGIGVNHNSAGAFDMYLFGAVLRFRC